MSDTRIFQEERVFHGLNALRGVAAIAVLLYHERLELGVPWLSQSGKLSVDLFFVISGFVIAHSYEQRIPTIGLVGFMRIRLIRFLPLFYLGGFFGLVRLALLVATGRTPDATIASAIAYFLFLPAPPDGSPSRALAPLNGPGWSLLLEIYVNFGYALLLRILSTRVLSVIVAAGAAALVWNLFDGNSQNDGVGWDGLFMTSARVIYSFSIGALMYRLRHHIPNIRIGNAIIVLCFILIVSMPDSIVWSCVVMTFLSPMLVMFAAYGGQDTFLSRYGANASYCIYALHSPLLMIAIGAANTVHLSPAIGLATATICLIAVAPIIDRKFDRPIRKALKRIHLPIGNTA